MFHFRPEQFGFDGVEDGVAEAFRPNDLDLTLPLQSQAAAGGAFVGAAGGGCLAHAAACVLACKARERIML